MDAIDLLARVYSARHELPADDATAARIVAGAARQFELFGIQRTTMEDIAKRAGVSRVTVYRRFANKERILEAVILREVQAFLVELAARAQDDQPDEEQVVEGLVFIVRTLRANTLLQRLLASEPELLLPQLTTGAGPLLAFARDHIVEYSRGRFPGVAREDLEVGAELGVRLVLSLVLTPDSVVDIDDTERMRRLVRRAVSLTSGGWP